MNKLLTLLLLLSGISSLTYQVVWVRLLGLSIGVTSAAVGAVLAAVFLGMAVGAWLSSYTPRYKMSGLRVFALVELTVGLSALLLLPVLLNLDYFLSIFPSLGTDLWFRFMLVTLLLAIPTAGIGAAYPLISNILIKRQTHLGRGISLLYFSYTLGAIFGALASAFILIPQWGLDGALYCAVVINLLVASLALLSSRYTVLPQHAAADIENKATATTKIKSSATWRGAVTLIVTGFSAIAIETGWIKYLSIYTGSTFYGFSILMAIFLGGIALGSILIRSYIDKIKDLHVALIIGLLLLGTLLFANRTGLGFLPVIEDYINTLHFSYFIEIWTRYIAVLIIIAPVTVVLGALFPLSMKCFCGDINHLRQRAGTGYAINTAAGLTGAVTAGLWLIPAYGTNFLLLCMAVTIVLVALLLSYSLFQRRTQIVLLVSAIAIITVGVRTPGLNFEKMIVCMECNADLIKQGRGPKVLYAKEGHTGVISLILHDNGNIDLRNNGLTEATLPVKRSRGEVLLGLLPSIFAPDAKNAFVVGYGAGITTQVLAATSVNTIKVVELEPMVVEAMRSIQSDTTTSLQDPRVELIYNDARNALQTDPSTYDIIISQPSHPWRNGVASFFSREFFDITKSRLSDDGVSIQWVNLWQMDITTLKGIIGSYYDVFPNGIVFTTRAPEQIFLLGSRNPFVMDRTVVDLVMQSPKMQPIMKEAALRTPEHLLQYFLFTRDEAVDMAGNAHRVTDLNILPETRLGRSDFDSRGETMKIYELLQNYAVSLLQRNEAN